MALKTTQDSPRREPAGFTQHSGGLASEYAREQGWGINEDERTRPPQGRQDTDGGTDFDCGPRDFGDTAVDTSQARPPGKSAQLNEPHAASARNKTRHKAAPRKSR